MRGSTVNTVVDNQIRRPGSKLVSDELSWFLSDEVYKGERPRLTLGECLRINAICHSNGYFDLRRCVQYHHELQRLIKLFGRTTPVRNVIYLREKGALE